MTLDQPLKAKIEAIVHQGVRRRRGGLLRRGGQGAGPAGRSWASASLPVCMAKTQYSLSDDPAKLGAAGGLHRHRVAR